MTAHFILPAGCTNTISLQESTSLKLLPPSHLCRALDPLAYPFFVLSTIARIVAHQAAARTAKGKGASQ